jgi:hypothetical protein
MRKGHMRHKMDERKIIHGDVNWIEVRKNRVSW